MKHLLILFIFIFSFNSAKATQLLIPMDDSQTNHLKAYGVAFWMLEHDVVIEWLLNYSRIILALEVS